MLRSVAQPLVEELPSWLKTLLEAIGLRRGEAPELVASISSLLLLIATPRPSSLIDPVGMLVNGLLIILPLIVSTARYVAGRRYRVEITLTSLVISTYIFYVNGLHPLLTPFYALVLWRLEDVESRLRVYTLDDRAYRLRRSVDETLRDIRFYILLLVGGSIYFYAYLLTGEGLFLLYPPALLILFVYSRYSAVYTPPESVGRMGRRIYSVAYPFHIFSELLIRLYNSEAMLRLGREAGYGVAYNVLLQRYATIYPALILLVVSTAPLIYIVAGAIPLIILLALVLSYPIMLRLYLSLRRGVRKSRIFNNLTSILFFHILATGVGWSFSEQMRRVYSEDWISKFLPLRGEAEIYLEMEKIRGGMYQAMEGYASTLPEENYRDIVYSWAGLEFDWGSEQVFKMLQDRFTRFVEGLRYIFMKRLDAVVEPLINVALLTSVVLPTMLMITQPALIPQIILLGAFVVAVMGYAVVGLYSPTMEGNYLYVARRRRMGFAIFIVASLLLNILLPTYFPRYTAGLIVMNLVLASALAVRYMFAPDMEVETTLRGKLYDIALNISGLVAMGRPVPDALYEVSQYPSTPQSLSEPLRRLARRLEGGGYASVEGTYHLRLLTFFLNIVKTGGLRREFVENLRRYQMAMDIVWTALRGLAGNLVILILIGVAIQLIALDFLHIAGITISGAGGVAGQLPIPVRGDTTPIYDASIMAMAVATTLIGWVIDYVASLTFNRPRIVFATYVMGLAILVLAGLHPLHGFVGIS